MRFPLDMFMIRLVLCCLCVLAQNALFVVEQPRQSLLFDHTRWQQFETAFVLRLFCNIVFLHFDWNYGKPSLCIRAYSA